MDVEVILVLQTRNVAGGKDVELVSLGIDADVAEVQQIVVAVHLRLEVQGNVEFVQDHGERF